jgi:transcriptional regulator with XRE-family HTH domain
MSTVLVSNSLRNLIASKVGAEQMLASKLKMGFVGDLWNLMKESNLTGKELAKKLDISEARVSKILKGDANLTIDTIAKLACAVNSEVSLSIKPVNAKPEIVDASNVYKLMNHIWAKNEAEKGIHSQISEQSSNALFVIFSTNGGTECCNDNLEFQGNAA